MYTDHNNDCYYNINYVYYNKKRFKNIWSSLYWLRRLFESSNSTFSNAMFHTQPLVSIENIKGAKISRKQCLIFNGLLVGWYLWGKIIIVLWSFVSWTAIVITISASWSSSVFAIMGSWSASVSWTWTMASFVPMAISRTMIIGIKIGKIIEEEIRMYTAADWMKRKSKH